MIARLTAWAVVTLALVAGPVFAQTGPTKDLGEAVDEAGTMAATALVLIPLIALAVLALFEPWKWFGRRKRRDRR